jgi:hypothetical protein
MVRYGTSVIAVGVTFVARGAQAVPNKRKLERMARTE